MSIGSNILNVQHLSWRAGFGADATFLQEWKNKPTEKLAKHMLQQKSLKPLQVVEVTDLSDLKKFRSMSREDKKALLKKNREMVKALNLDWLHEMYMTDAPFQEKMALFWHGHFACRVGNALHNQQLLQIIRDNALGNFGDLLIAVSKSAAMLQFLNNQQNRKQHANENFAREVMELFTMGRGNYTEKDVKEGARAFTGWGYDFEGNFKFRPFFHDDGTKTFLGKTGNFDGDDVLKILLEHKATAYHITEKLYRYYVNDQPDKAVVQSLADHFYNAGYDIKSLMHQMFTADWFYDKKNIAVNIKSPVELLVGMQRSIPVQYKNDRVELLFQRVMDQVLFYPPNVAGWPGGRSWIDSSTLMFRMRLPQIVYYNESFNIQPKDMPDEMTDGSMMKSSELFNRSMSERLKAEPNWDAYIKSFTGVEQKDLPKAIADVLLVNVPSTVNEQLLNNYADISDREKYIKTLSIDLMSIPEYQLC